MYNPMFTPYGGQQYQQPVEDRIWVENEFAARSYLVAPNGFVRLWDSSRPAFYEKRADASGRPYPMEAYTYSKIDDSGLFSGSNPSEDKSIIDRIKTLEFRILALENGKEKDDVSEPHTDDK